MYLLLHTVYLYVVNVQGTFREIIHDILRKIVQDALTEIVQGALGGTVQGTLRNIEKKVYKR